MQACRHGGGFGALSALCKGILKRTTCCVSGIQKVISLNRNFYRWGCMEWAIFWGRHMSLARREKQKSSFCSQVITFIWFSHIHHQKEFLIVLIIEKCFCFVSVLDALVQNHSQEFVLSYVDHQNQKGECALLWAVILNDTQSFDRLVSMGCNTELQSLSGRTPMNAATDLHDRGRQRIG